MKITTRRRASPRGWINDVLVDGRATALTVTKGEKPKYREPQMFDVCRGENFDDYLFEAKGLHACVSALQVIADELGRP
jgi:hypothetical protein